MTNIDNLFTRSTSADAVNESARAHRGRRMSWQEFYSLRPDLKPANDNEREVEAA